MVRDGYTRVSVDMTHELRETLVDAELTDGITTAARIRAMVELWSTNEQIRAKVNRRALENRAAGKK